MGEDRREHERFELEMEVDYRSGDNFLFAYISNISEMGIFIRSDEPLPLGTVLELMFHPDGEAPLEVRGQVVWVNPVKPVGENLNPGMGVRFIGLTSEQRERVVGLVKTIAYLADDPVN